jgi:hypothetical protein
LVQEGKNWNGREKKWRKEVKKNWEKEKWGRGMGPGRKGEWGGWSKNEKENRKKNGEEQEGKGKVEQEE